MKVLVTGASGFIGSALMKKLLELGYEPRALVRDGGKLGRLGLKVMDIVEGDITDGDAVERAVEGVERIFHIAGAFRETDIPHQRYYDVNVQGTLKVLSAAEKYGVRRVIHCSTCGIHGNIKEKPANEEHELALDDIYERTKAEGEMRAMQFGKERGVEVTALRPTGVYGPGDARLLKLFKMVNARVTLWFGPGTAHYHLVYIDDVVDAFLLAAEAEQAAGESFLIGGRELPTLNEVVGELTGVLGKQELRMIRLPSAPFLLLGSICEKACLPLGIKPPIYRRRMDFFVKNRAFDISKASKLLGYDPKVDMAEGLRRTADWYRQMAML